MGVWAFAQKAAQDVAVRGRLALSVFGHPSALMQSRSGLVQDGGGVVTVSAGTMNVTVGKFRGVVQGTAAQGAYPVVVDADTVVTMPNGTASDKTYRVGAHVRDTAYDGSGFTDAIVTYWDPAAPPAGLLLPVREVTVPANRTAGNGGLAGGNLGVDLRTYLISPGHTIAAASQAIRDALFAVPGLQVFRTDLGLYERYSGSAWATLLDNIRCTSATRPAHVEGRLIYETDTDRIYASDGANWKMVYDLATLDPALYFAGTETAVFGTSPPAGTKKVFKAESVVGTVVGSGGGVTINYDVAFANGIVSVVTMPGDPGPGNAMLTRMASGGYALASFLVQCYNTTPAVIAAGQQVRVNYWAVGW